LLLDVSARIRVYEQYAYVISGGADAITVVDVSDPTSPAITGSVSDPLLDLGVGLDIEVPI